MGGAETWLMEVLRRWAASGTGQMDFLLTGGRPEIFDDEARRLGARLHYVRYCRAQLSTFVPEYRSLLRRGNYDAIHDHADYAAGWRLAMGAGMLPPVRVVHIHNPWLHISANYAVNPRRRVATKGGKALTKALASDVCGTSEEILCRYGFTPTKSGHPRVSVLHCGFNIDRFNAPREKDRVRVLAELGWAADTKLVLFAGRLDRALEMNHPQNHKNSWLALNIVRTAAARDSSVRLLMAGDGPSREALIRAVHEWGMADKLRIPGIRQDMPALMRAADVLLFPSAQEGLGMAAVEAQAAGLPVLASTAVPHEAIVIPSIYEVLPLSTAVETWVDKLLEIMDRPRPNRKACRAVVEASDFSISRSAARLKMLYSGEL
ncbi:MAG: glycosyltransferase [Acidobacteriota bacterium]